MPDDRKKVSWKFKIFCFLMSIISFLFIPGMIVFNVFDPFWLTLALFLGVVWFGLPVKIIRDEQQAKAWRKHQEAQERMRQDEEKRRKQDLLNTLSPEELHRRAKEEEFEREQRRNQRLSTSIELEARFRERAKIYK